METNQLLDKNSNIDPSSAKDENKAPLPNMNPNLLTPGQFPQFKIKKCAYLTSTPIDVLNNLFSIYIREKPSLIQNLGYMKTRNFKMFACPEIPSTEIPKSKVPIFICNEQYNNCQCGDEEYLQSEILFRSGTTNGIQYVPFCILKMDNSSFECGQPYKSLRKVYYKGPESKLQEGDFLGTITYDTSCCEMKFSIFMGKNYSNGGENFIITRPFGEDDCCSTNFNIYYKNGGKIGHITQISSSGDYSNCGSDKYVSGFLKKLNWNEKAMIVSSIIFVGHELFNQRRDRFANS